MGGKTPMGYADGSHSKSGSQPVTASEPPKALLLTAAARMAEVAGLKRDLGRVEEELDLMKRQLEDNKVSFTLHLPLFFCRPSIRTGALMSQEPERAAMAAASGELPPAATREKKDPGFAESSPAVPAMAAEDGWSTLPGDLVRRIADSFLDDNDLDWYMDYRAVCTGWRAATDDPRFRSSRWIVLDEACQSQGNLLLLNTHTGRFLRKNLLQVGDYHVVATTLDGYFVLAEKTAPHAARVLNPLTGAVIRFAAPVPPDVGIADVISPHGSSLRLAVFSDSSRKAYSAAPHNNSFVRYNHNQPSDYDFYRKAVVGGVYASFSEASVVREMIICLGKLLPVNLAPVTEVFSLDLPGHGYGMRCFLVDLHGHICIVMKILNPQGVLALFAYQFDTETGILWRLKTTDRYAIFIGDHRCFSVDVDEFPGTEPDCVYYIQHLGSSAHISKCNIKDNKIERISEAADFVKQDNKFVLVADRPYTIIHLLASYTINNPDSQLALQQIP
ncbi:uncharacterized protein LOC119279994 [Triticum dicoccoides]|uniref:uncharacterized protein LOC119279994 n=1 Tax=Triticum dicoccoides TaxID=85692 RepID=UPI00188F3D56|nr:uncharacterized protein LOC119279994 [Triticum dicoccoides]